MWNWQLSALASGCRLVALRRPADRAGDALASRRPPRRSRSSARARPTCSSARTAALAAPRAAARRPARRALDRLGPARLAVRLGPRARRARCRCSRSPAAPTSSAASCSATRTCRSAAAGSSAAAWASTCRRWRPATRPDRGRRARLPQPVPVPPAGLLRRRRAARFHDAYFGENPGVWTHGDLIEFDADGQARIHGRSDGVLNIHGVRIGPAEIYRALRDVPEVREAMAVEQRTDGLRRRPAWCSLVVLRDGAALDGAPHRRHPARIVSARVAGARAGADRRRSTSCRPPTAASAPSAPRGTRSTALPAGNSAALANPGCLEEIRARGDLAGGATAELAGAPSTHAARAPREARLRAIWEGVLGVAPLAPDDNFFDVGGTSLAAVRLFQAIHDHLGVDLPLSTLAARPDDRGPGRGDRQPGRGPGALARAPARRHGRAAAVPRSLHQRRRAAAAPARAPPRHRPARLRDPGAAGSTRARRPRPAWRRWRRPTSRRSGRSSPPGPYDLAGHSFGGLVAFEMARILTSQGERVGWLGLIDTHVHPACLPGARPGAIRDGARPSASSAPRCAHHAGGCRATWRRRSSASRPGRRWPRRRRSGRCRLCSTGWSGSAWRRSPSTAPAPTRATRPCSSPRAASREPAIHFRCGARRWAARSRSWRSPVGTSTPSASRTWACSPRGSANACATWA